MIICKEINGKDIHDDLFSIRDKQLEKDDSVDNLNQQTKKIKKPRKPKNKN